MGWLAWVEKSFTEDSVHIDRELGTYRGRQAIKEWMESLLPMFPPVFSYELEWYMIDGDRVVTYHRDGFPDPRGGSPFDCAVITVLRYTGDGRWSYEEDVYNPKELENALSDYTAAQAEVQVGG